MSIPEQRRMAVVGAGTMGPGIALTFAIAGWDVDLIGRSPERLNQARERMETSLERFVVTATLNQEEASRALDRMTIVSGLPETDPGWDLVIESITEDLNTKLDLFSWLEELVSPTTVIASNTSSLSVDELANGMRHPERSLGFHWLNPAEFVDLVEIIVAKDTAQEVVERALAWSREVGKTPVKVSRDTPGFIINRLQYALLREAFTLVEEGIVTVEDVDAAMTAGLGARWAVVGPFEGLDLGGLDVYAAVAPRLYPELSTTLEPSPIATDLVAEGACGCKSGRGTRGEYVPEDTATLVLRRDSMLLELHALREGS